VIEADTVLVEGVRGDGTQAEQRIPEPVDHTAEQESELLTGRVVGSFGNLVGDR